MPVLAFVFNCVGVDARKRKTGFFFCYCKPVTSIFITVMWLMMMMMIRGLISTQPSNYHHEFGVFVYHSSGPLLILLAVMVSTVAQILLLIFGKLRPTQHLHSQPVVNHLHASLTVCQAHLGCTLHKHRKSHYMQGKNLIRAVQEQSSSVQIAAPKACRVRLSDLPVAPPEPEVPASRQRAAERTPPGCSQGQECRSPH